MDLPIDSVYYRYDRYCMVEHWAERLNLIAEGFPLGGMYAFDVGQYSIAYKVCCLENKNRSVLTGHSKFSRVVKSALRQGPLTAKRKPS